MTTISAQTILRSRNSASPDKVLSTLLLRYPRFIHAEFMTHRQLSRNAASSRAIPVKKLIQDVMENPAVPLHWGANQKGMQADIQHDEVVHIGGADIITADEDEWLDRKEAWLRARDTAVHFASAFAEAGYHKQICNRLLEPFAHITVLASATEWSNFVALRDHPDAEPHIQMLAKEVRRELDREDNIQILLPGQWHTPFVEDWEDITKLETNWLGAALAKSVACCASTSYKTVDGFDMTLVKAFEIHNRLLSAVPMHASPAEHVAQADNRVRCPMTGQLERWEKLHQHGNFTGFRQYRKMLPNECL